MSGKLRRTRCAGCGRELFVEAGRDDRGESVEDYHTREGWSLNENERGEQVCSCGWVVSGA